MAGGRLGPRHACGAASSGVAERDDGVDRRVISRELVHCDIAQNATERRKLFASVAEILAECAPRTRHDGRCYWAVTSESTRSMWVASLLSRRKIS